MDFPNYEPVAASPEIADVGLAIHLEEKVFGMTQPVTVYGSYVVDGDFIQKTNDEPDTWIYLILIRKDKPAVWHKPVLEKPNLAPVAPPSDETVDPSVRSGGYFNLELRAHFGFPSEPGRYTLFAVMGDFKTDPIDFQIVNK